MQLGSGQGSVKKNSKKPGLTRVTREQAAAHEHHFSRDPTPTIWSFKSFGLPGRVECLVALFGLFRLALEVLVVISLGGKPFEGGVGV